MDRSHTQFGPRVIEPAHHPTSATLIQVWRKRFQLVLFGALLIAPTIADAGVFGGFSPDGRYKHGENVCSPVSEKRGTPTCRSDVKGLSFQHGQLQAGSSSKLSVQKKGTRLKVVTEEKTLFVWDSGEILNSVGDVYLDATGTRVAIEYSTRFGGRVIESVVVLQLAASVTPNVTTPAPSVTPKPTLDTPTSKVPAAPPEFAKAMKAGIRWSKRRKHSKATSSFESALRVIPGQPEALYWLAKSQYGAKNTASAKKTLSLLGGMTDESGIRWRVEARFDKQFKALRGDPDFRNAVGIDRKPGTSISTYERLVALGGKWEQESLPCEQPQVNLTLQRDKKRRFDLVIRSKCQGTTETTRLDGSWLATTNLMLRFPNMGSDDDALTCRLEVCADGSGEDCLRCQPEPDLEFLLRVVRR